MHLPKILIDGMNEMFWMISCLLLIIVVTTVLFFAGERNAAWFVANIGTVLVFMGVGLAILFGKDRSVSSDSLVNRITRSRRH
jgi:hypothetical protein